MERVATRQGRITSTRFQFSKESVDATGTLSELIASLNIEIVKMNGELITRRSLQRTLNFLQSSIGVKVISTKQLLPVATLKTIRLLFLSDQSHKRNVLQLLSPPKDESKAFMEFSTTTTLPRDNEASSLIQTLCDSLAIEIDPSRLETISQVIPQRKDHSFAEELLLHAGRATDEVSRIVYEAFFYDDELLASATSALTRPLEQPSFDLIEGNTPQAHEAMYVYLQTLSFRHFVLHYPRHLEETRVEIKIGSIRELAVRFCRMATHPARAHYGPGARVFSISTYHYLLLEYPEEMCVLVHEATSIPTSVDQLQSHEDRAKALLMSYSLRTFDCADPDALVLSVYDVVAAFSSFCYQQKHGHKYKPYWHGQKDQGEDPKRLFKKGLNKDDPHQHQGVIQIYLNRFYEYRASFHGRTASHRAWMNYQITVLRAYHLMLDRKDITAITIGLPVLSFYCVAAAQDFVFDHSRLAR
ncbi:hypothetical protein ABE494_08205 [Stenotrophomonas lactitubi]|uniref:hypothetical protein n=1 Tax=Stenotrophomonas lactitubi TaxID=2045214 RepID=UPI00320B88E9